MPWYIMAVSTTGSISCKNRSRNRTSPRGFAISWTKPEEANARRALASLADRVQSGRRLRISKQRLCDPQDPISAVARFRPMRNTDACDPQPVHALVDPPLVLHIQMRCALVEKQDSWLTVQRSRE